MQDVARSLFSAMNAIGEAFYLLDREWRFLFVNRAAERLMERPPGSLLGRNVWEEFPPARDSIFGREMKRAVETGHSHQFTARYGPLKRWFDVHLFPTDGSLAVAFRDANLRVEFEQLRDLESRLATTALEGRGLSALVSAAVETIRESADWAVGEAWLLRPDGSWALGAIHTRGGDRLERFAAQSREVRLGRSEGLPGIAMASDGLVHFRALGPEDGFIRDTPASEAGLVAGVAVALHDGGRPIAVLAFLHDAPLDDDSWRHLLEALRPRLAEIVLRERAAAVLDQFFRLSSDGMAVYGADGRFRRVNPSLCRMLGRPEAELLEETLESLVHPDEIAAAFAQFADLQAGRGLEEFETRIRHGDGSWRRIVWSARYDDAEGMLYTTARDVTVQRRDEAVAEARHRTLDALSRGEELGAVLGHVVDALELMLPAARASVLLVRDGRVWLGAAPSLPQDFSQAIHGEPIGPKAGSCGTAAWRNRMVIVTDIASDPLWAQYRDLAIPHGLVACWSIPFHDAAGRVIGTLAVYPDVPRGPEAAELDAAVALAKFAAIAVERWNTAQQLRLLETAVAQLNDIVMITEGSPLDEPGPRIRFVNQAFERITGWRREEAIGRSPRFLQDERTDRGVLDRVRGALREGRAIREEVVNRRKDGAPVWVEMEISPVMDDQGAVEHWVAVERDVTARHQLEEQLRESQKMEAVGRLAGGVAHDFNNMLTAIHGFAELLLLDVQDAAHQAHAQEIIRAAERSSDLTRKLLAFARRQVLQPQVVDLSALVRELGPLLARLMGEAIRQEIFLAPDALPAKVDPGQIEQVILNLAINARDAMPDGGTLTIETAAVILDDDYAESHRGVAPGEYVMVAVSDTGIGMSPEVRARIFEPFFTTKGERGGTGLGLSTVLGIVEQSGGHLWVYSEPGEGTTFKAYFRRARTAPVPPLAATIAAVPPRTATILVVEDEEQLRSLVRRMLEREGYVVLDTGDAEAAPAIAAAHAGPIDLLLTDVVLPRLNGRLVAEAVSRVRPGIPVLYMSGYTENAIVHHGVLKEGIAFLEKPFTRQDLLARIAAMLPPR